MKTKFGLISKPQFQSSGLRIPHHVAFKTVNYEAMVDFYSRLFGCEPLYTSEELTFLSF